MNGYGTLNQELDSSQPNTLNQELDSSQPNSADAGNSGTDVQLSPLFSSPSTVDDDDDDNDERDNFIQNIVSMLTPDVGSSVEAVSTKTTADKATESDVVWNLEDIDVVLQQTESYSPVHAVNTKTTADKATETNVLWDLDDLNDLFQAIDSYTKPAAASSCEVSVSQSSTLLPVYNTTLDGTELPAVSQSSTLLPAYSTTSKGAELPTVSQSSALLPAYSTTSKGAELPAVSHNHHNMSFTSGCHYCHSGNCSLGFSSSPYPKNAK